MPKPEPIPINPGELRNLALAVLKAAKIPCLATVENDQPRLRPVSPVLIDGFTVYVANLRYYGKTNQIAENPKVELCYLDGVHNQVRITGVASILEDSELFDEIWENNPLLKHYLGSKNNPDLIIYKIEPLQVRFMQEWALKYHEVPLD